MDAPRRIPESDAVNLMPLALLDLTLPTLEENLALDEALLLDAEEGIGGEMLRFWEWPNPAVVLGAGGRLAGDVDEEACRIDGVPLQRRASGGGTVLLGKGCLLFSLVLAFDREGALKEIHSSYRFILSRLTAALAPLVGAEPMGISDLAVAGRKFSGNAQQRKRGHLLHHGTLLCGFELARISRYLRLPEKQPAYREGRPHESFLMNLSVDSGELRRLLQDEWQPEERSVAIPEGRIANLVAEKYSRSEWVWRR